MPGNEMTNGKVQAKINDEDFQRSSPSGNPTTYKRSTNIPKPPINLSPGSCYHLNQ